MCSENLSKKLIASVHLSVTLKKSKLIIFIGMTNSRKLLGQGTLSYTSGMVLKI